MNSHLVNTHLFPGESIVTSSCDDAIVISYSLSVLRAHGISIFIVFAIWHSIKVCRNARIFSLIYLCVCITICLRNTVCGGLYLYFLQS